jgi:hypothetical protein
MIRGDCIAKALKILATVFVLTAPRFAVSRESILALDACLIDVCLSREGFRRLTIWWYLEQDRTRGLDQYFVRNVFLSLGKEGTVQFFIVLDFYFLNRFWVDTSILCNKS